MRKNESLVSGDDKCKHANPYISLAESKSKVETDLQGTRLVTDTKPKKFDLDYCDSPSNARFENSSENIAKQLLT